MSHIRHSYQIGYTHFGPLLYSYLQWLVRNVEDTGCNTIYCFARDGYIVNEGLALMGDKIKGRYVYISRRSIITAILQYKYSLSDMMKSYKSWPRYISLEKLLYRLGLSPEDYKNDMFAEFLEKYHYLRVVDIPKMKEIELVINQLRPIIHEKSRIQAKLIREYFNQLGLIDKVACVDLGGQCSIEQALNEYIQKNNSIKLEPHMFYVYVTNSENSNTPKAFFNELGLKDMDVIFRFSYMWLEILFSAPHGSVLGYKRTDSDIVPILEEHVYDTYGRSLDKNRIIELQKGALAFIKDCQQGYVSAIDPVMAWNEWKTFTLYPTSKDADIWGDIYIDGDEFEPLAKPMTWAYYITHNKKLLKNLKESQWLAGFLTRFSGRLINFLFVKIYQMVKRVI